MDVDMPEAPQPAQNRQGGEFKARLNRDIAFTIIDEQIQAGIEPAQLTGRGLAKQYGFGSPQTWVTHLKEWRQLRGLAPGSEDVKEAETAPADDEEGDDAPGTSDTAANPGGGGYGMISRTEFLQHQEMWNRLLSEREQAHAERLKVARMEGVQVGRDAGRQEGQALAEARELTLQERARRERLEGEREGAMKAQQELAVRLGGERRLLVSRGTGWRRSDVVGHGENNGGRTGRTGRTATGDPAHRPAPVRSACGGGADRSTDRAGRTCRSGVPAGGTRRTPRECIARTCRACRALPVGGTDISTPSPPATPSAWPDRLR
jgi:hypothetical protein